MENTLAGLRSRYDNSDHVWFFVKSNYRIIDFNRKAAKNSIALHNKEIAPGDSILDFARDTRNEIDGDFITCFGKAAAGQLVETQQEICYRDSIIRTRSSYTPLYEGNILLGISIVVEDLTDKKAS